MRLTTFVFTQSAGNKIEAVIRLEGGEDHVQAQEKTMETGEEPKREVARETGGAGVIKLVDAQNNQFVLSKGKDTTIPIEDHHFIHVCIVSYGLVKEEYCTRKCHQKLLFCIIGDGRHIIVFYKTVTLFCTCLQLKQPESYALH